MSLAPMPVVVAIGLIRRGEAYLIRQRPALPGSPMPGYWEFPGGKCQEGEPPDLAVRRECLEEVGLAVAVRRLRRVHRHVYPHEFVELHFFDCEPEAPGAEPDPATGFRWVAGRELGAYTFPNGNDPIITELVAEARPATGRR